VSASAKQSQTTSVAASAALVLALVVMALSSTLSQTKPLTALAGLLSSLVFALSLLALGNAQKSAAWRTLFTVNPLSLSLFLSDHSSAAEVLACLAVAVFTASRVHGVAVTLCVAFSGLWLAWIASASEKIHK
jgi:hypothetical protein